VHEVQIVKERLSLGVVQQCLQLAWQAERFHYLLAELQERRDCFGDWHFDES